MWLIELVFPQFRKSDRFEVRISRSTLESPLEFEITRVDCTRGPKPFVFARNLSLNSDAVPYYKNITIIYLKYENKKVINLTVLWEVPNTSR